MSNNESFIDEVTEEVRRDQLYGLLRRYGWIGIAAVLLLVGGASVNEWRKARAQSLAETTGDAILAASAARDPALLDEIATGGEIDAVLGLIAAADSAEPAAAAERLAALAADAATPALYRDLAVLKHALLPGQMSPADRIAALGALTAPGAPFRVIAEEQIALAEAEQGETEAAVARLSALLDDTEASGALRQRAQQLIVALGGEQPAPEPIVVTGPDGAEASEGAAEDAGVAGPEATETGATETGATD